MEKHLNHARRAIVILIVLCMGIAWQAWHTTQRADAMIEACSTMLNQTLDSK